jgi:hypothetical protein
MTADIITFPEPAEREISKEEVDEFHSKNFRDLESRISDCVTMSDIAMQLAQPLLGGLEPGHERAFFAVIQVNRMLERLKVDYLAAWHGEVELTE